MYVADYMTRRPVTVLETDPLSKAQTVAKARSVHQLPVIDSSGRLVGIITDRDIRSAVGYDRTLVEKLQVQEVMTCDPVTVGPDTTLEDALKYFTRRRFGALPVVCRRELIGIITRHDLLTAMAVMLGLDCAGASIEVALPDPLEDLVAVFQAVRRLEPDLHAAVVSQMRRDGDEPSLYLRVNGKDKPAAEKLLRRAGLILLEPERPHSMGT